jgi:dUTP pyrophosphatase
MFVLNSPGTVDCDFRGEIKVILSCQAWITTVHKGDRVAQIVFMLVPKVQLIEVEELDETPRGEGGFGSTGR